MSDDIKEICEKVSSLVPLLLVLLGRDRVWECVSNKSQTCTHLLKYHYLDYKEVVCCCKTSR